MCGLGSNICILTIIILVIIILIIIILVILNSFNNNIFNINIIVRLRANVWSWLGQLALGKRLVSIFTLDRWSS